MSATSATGGYLPPEPSPGVLDDETLEDVFQALIVSITGLPGQSVRPRWQPEQTNIPPFNETWAAIGITDRAADTFAYVGHRPDDDGRDVVFRSEELTLLCSFYGPKANSTASRLRDGLSVAQNREALGLLGIAVVSAGDQITVPALINNRWHHAIDMAIFFRRGIVRNYQVLNLLGLDMSIHSISSSTPPITERWLLDQDGGRFVLADDAHGVRA